MKDMGKNDEQVTIPDLTNKMADFSAAREREGYSSLCLENVLKKTS